MENTLQSGENIEVESIGASHKRLPKIAVLMATYNGERFIEEQLLSVLRQYGVDLHIFISDDCSTDSTLQIVEDTATKFGRITVISEGIKFGSAGKNFISLISSQCFSDFDYVALADQDDIWLSNKLTAAVSCIEEKKIEAYSANVIAFWNEKTKVKAIVKSQKMRKYDHLFEAAGPGCTYVFTASSLLPFARKFRDNPEFLQNVFQHDWLLYFYYRNRRLKWHIASDFVLLYRQHESNDFGVSSSYRGVLRRLRSIFNGSAKCEVLSHFEIFGIDQTNVRSRIFLLKHIGQLRRRVLDRVLLFVFIVTLMY